MGKTGSIADESHWYIAVVKPNTEKACEKKLVDFFTIDGHPSLEFETYVPSQRELHEWSSGRRKWVDRVVCTCYLFVRCSSSVRYTIKSRVPFILSFMKDRAMKENAYGMSPFAYIPDSQMDQLKQMVGEADTPVTIDPSRLHIGSKVRVKSGRLKDFEGYLYREPDGRTNITIRLNILGYAKIEMPMALLELVDEETR